jgi:hypothetical protein
MKSLVALFIAVLTKSNLMAGIVKLIFEMM